MKIKLGDVFSIPVFENYYSIGHIIYIPNNDYFLIVVYKGIFNLDEIENIDISTLDILLIGYTMDAKFYHRNWLVFANNKFDLNSIVLPFYKIGTSVNASLLNFKEKEVRKCNEDEYNNLTFMTVVAPVRFENVLKALYGHSEWNEKYNPLMYKHVYNTNYKLKLGHFEGKKKPTE